jgi:hypothetical protein
MRELVELAMGMDRTTFAALITIGEVLLECPKKPG